LHLISVGDIAGIQAACVGKLSAAFTVARPSLGWQLLTAQNPSGPQLQAQLAPTAAASVTVLGVPGQALDD
jgi:hypothetical protein